MVMVYIVSGVPADIASHCFSKLFCLNQFFHNKNTSTEKGLDSL